jgi:hypothetical protein
VDVFTNTRYSNSDKDNNNQIELEFKADDCGKVDDVHWLQFTRDYFLDAKGKLLYFPPSEQPTEDNIGLRFGSTDQDLLQRTDGMESYVDTASKDLNYAFYDFAKGDIHSTYIRNECEISIFDAPTFRTRHIKGAKTGIVAADSFLVTDKGRVLYQVHWEKAKDYASGKETYQNIWGRKTSMLPPFAFGETLIRGYEHANTDAKKGPVQLLDPIPVNNPIPEATRSQWERHYLVEGNRQRNG